MLIEDLFDEVLVSPLKKKGVNRLQIVSGFATASMADKHMEILAALERQVGIDLIVGMTQQNGIEKAQHYALQKLAKDQPYGMDFTCRYVVTGNPVHAKTYCWFNGKQPVAGFIGSANYTLTGFGGFQTEVMEHADGWSAADFYKQVKRQTMDCLDKKIEDMITLMETRKIQDEGEAITLSLLEKRTGETPKRSGINWGQRDNRDRDQAYINLPAKIGRSDFFPERSRQFTVLTDDQKSFIMVRAQDKGKGLQTTQSNALLGKYLRKRMGLASGQYVTLEHLVRYGRTDVTFTKIDNETFLLDFQPEEKTGKEK